MLAAAFSRYASPTRSSVQLCPGLFGMSKFRDPTTFLKESHDSIERCNVLIESCTSQASWPLATIVRRLDTLSDMICFVIDSAELIRNVHPDSSWRNAADKSYLLLGNLINRLNTHSGLFKVIDASIKAARHDTVDEETMEVAHLFYKDFVKAGVHMVSAKRSELVSINDRINALGHDFSQRSIAKSKDAVAVLEEMLVERYRLARLLGYSSYAQFFLGDKMARTPENVLNYLRRQNMPISRQRRYGSNQIQLEAKFTVGSVIQGVSSIMENLFNIRLDIKDPYLGETWHSSVKRLDVFDVKTNEKLGTIYCDLFRRQDGSKGISPSQFTIRCHRRIDKDEPGCFSDTHYSDLEYLGVSRSYQLPVVVLTCDFEPPTKNGEKFLDFGSVQTLMHEFGHAMHSMMAKTEYQHVSGTRCKLDFVETPSILMELIANDGWAIDKLRCDPLIYRKYEINACTLSQPSILSIGDDPTDRQQQIFFATLDQLYHGELRSNFIDTTKIYEKALRDHKAAQFFSSGDNQRNFNHLFNYGAGYYSYLWCRSLANRIYDHLLKESFSLRDKDSIYEAGEIITAEMLRYGGSKDPWKMNWSKLTGRELAVDDFLG